MKNLKTRSKLLLGFGIVAALLLVVGVFSLYGLTEMNTGSDLLSDNYMTAVVQASDIEFLTESQQAYLLRLYLRIDDTARINEIIDTIRLRDSEVQNAMAAFRKAIDGIEISGMKSVQEFDALYFGEYLATVEELIGYAQKGNEAALEQALIDSTEVFDKLNVYINDIVSSSERDSQNYNTTLTKTANTLIVTIIIISVIAVFAAIALGVYNSKIIAVPLVALTGTAKEVAIGNMDVSIEHDRKDEIGELATTFESMVTAIKGQSEFLDLVAAGDYRSEIPVRSDKDSMNLSLNKLVDNNNQMIAKIRSSSEQVSSASSQIAQAAQTLASGSTEQAASVDEFTSTLNDILGETNRNADISAQAMESVNESVRYMQESAEFMVELLAAMESIDDSAQSITKVIKTIEDIAFQTNILALNAAVEAARAGQHGKGFAVVAEEVRSLASSSSVAAKETAELIENSAQRVKEGNELVSKTNACMQKVATSAEKVQTAISIIAEASQHQSVAISELHQGLEQISQVVQANSATSQETAASAQEMSSQAMMLDKTVAEFRLSEKYDKRLGGGSVRPVVSDRPSEYREYAASSDYGKY